MERDELITEFYALLTTFVDLSSQIKAHNALMLDAGFTENEIDALAREFQDALEAEDSQP